MNNTPDSPAKTPDDRMDQGENYWTLFTPGIWKVLHAVLHGSGTALIRPMIRYGNSIWRVCGAEIEPCQFASLKDEAKD